METKEAVFLFDSGQRKIMAVNVDDIFRWCYQRERDLRDWAQFIAARKGWLSHGILRDINIEGE